jgi:hypothetical protein
VAGAVALAAFLAASWGRAQAPEPLPDLNAIIDESIRPLEIIRNKAVDPADVAEGCAGGLTGRTLLAFTLSTENLGSADLVLGDPGCPPCDADPPPACENPLYECSIAAGHFHAHFSRFARYEVLPAADAPAAVIGRKQGFCIEDTLCPPERKAYDCEFQGITAGCKDSYPALLGCQYVDVTDLPGGRYLLRASVNADRLLPESNYDNNTAEVPFEMCDATKSGFLRVASRGRGAKRLRARGHVGFERRPLVGTSPLRDGALVRIVFDGAPAFEVAIPGGRRGTGCDPRDGWKRLAGNRAGWLYTNASGSLDGACTESAAGLRALRLGRRRHGFAYAVTFDASPGPLVAPARATVTVVTGRVTGPCGAHTSPCAAAGGREGFACRGRDPCRVDSTAPGCDGGGGGGSVPGLRSFSAAAGAEPAGTHLFTSALTGADVSNGGMVGGLGLYAGPPGPDGVAALRLATDSVFGFAIIDGSTLCVQVDAAGSGGKIDCDGGTAVGVTLSGNSHGEGDDDAPVLRLEQGEPGPPGSGYVMANVRVVICGSAAFGSDPACIGALASAADCTDPAKVDFGAAAIQQTTAFTTGSATAEVENPQAGSLGGALPQTRTGRPFDCGDWGENGPGILVAPQIGYAQPVAGDTANVIQVDD